MIIVLVRVGEILYVGGCVAWRAGLGGDFVVAAARAAAETTTTTGKTATDDGGGAHGLAGGGAELVHLHVLVLLGRRDGRGVFDTSSRGVLPAGHVREGIFIGDDGFLGCGCVELGVLRDGPGVIVNRCHGGRRIVVDGRSGGLVAVVCGRRRMVCWRRRVGVFGTLASAIVVVTGWTA